jgi:hypothetical protein
MAELFIRMVRSISCQNIEESPLLTYGERGNMEIQNNRLVLAFLSGILPYLVHQRVK